MRSSARLDAALECPPRIGPVSRMHRATSVPQALPTVVYEDRPPVLPRRKPSPLAVVLFALAVLGLVISITCLILLVVLLADTVLVKKASTVASIGKRSVDEEYVHEEQHYAAHSIQKRQTSCPSTTDEVTFACVDDYKPFCFANGAEIIGLMRDAMDCACSQKSKTCRLIKVPAVESWDGDAQFSNVLYNSGSLVYAVGGYSMTVERQPVVDLMGEIYDRFAASFYKASSNSATITAVNGYKVGVLKHSSATKGCLARNSVTQYSSVTEYDLAIDMYNALVTSKQIDLAFLSDDIFQAKGWTDVTKTAINGIQCSSQGGGWLVSKNAASSGCIRSWFEDGLRSSTCVSLIKSKCLQYKNQGLGDPNCSGVFKP